jgi:hypothetical protein
MSRRISKVRGPIRSIVTVAFLPFVVLGVLVLAVRLYGWVRYNPTYFTRAYVEQYSTPEAAARALEQAIQTNDKRLRAEVEGLRWPGRFETRPSVALVMLWERNDRYRVYLYFDRQTYERLLVPVEQVRGRWVVSPLDLTYALHSGQWRRVFFPAAIAWWVLGAAGAGAVWLCRRSARLRRWLLGS